MKCASGGALPMRPVSRGQEKKRSILGSLFLLSSEVFSYWPASTGAGPMQFLPFSVAKLHHSGVCGYLNIP